MTEKIGFIGVGYLAETMIRGLAAQGRAAGVILSPRSAERSARLAGEFGCHAAASNADVVAGADVVFVATLPGQVVDTITGLPWRAGQRVISVAAGVPLAPMTAAAAPAKAFRAMPVTSASIGESATALLPGDEIAREALAPFGRVECFEDETAFEAASNLGAFYGLVFAMIAEVSRWTEAQGVPAEQARCLTAGMVRGAASVALGKPDADADDILYDLMTPGGITAAGLESLQATGGLAAWPRAMDAALARLAELGK